MTQQTHTQGTMEWSDTSLIIGEVCVAVIEESGEYAAPFDERAANAARLAAAWNAVDGIPTADLEAGVVAEWRDKAARYDNARYDDLCK